MHLMINSTNVSLTKKYDSLLQNVTNWSTMADSQNLKFRTVNSIRSFYAQFHRQNRGNYPFEMTENFSDKIEEQTALTSCFAFSGRGSL